MDVTAFKRLFLPMQQAMYAAAYSLSHNPQEAEDMVQEAYLRLWTQRDRLPQMDNPLAYCLTLQRRICIDRKRKRQLDQVDREPAELPLSSQQDVEQALATADIADHVKRLIGQLPERERTIITLKDVEGRDNSEIAALTGLSLGNLRVTLSRARKAIRAHFRPTSNPK